MENARPSQLLESQHRRIDTGIESIVAGTGLLSGLADSLALLQKHNPKEERILYTAADRLGAERADGALTKALTAGRMPEDWVCPTALH